MSAYTVMASLVPDVVKELERLKRKAEKYGQSISWTVGNEYATGRNIISSQGNERIIVQDVTIDSEIIKAGDYAVIAMIEHLDGGNVVTMFDADMSVNPAWRSAPAHCEHCGISRDRLITYLVQGNDGIKQVGSSCLRDYSGINPQLIGINNQLSDLLLEAVEYRNINMQGSSIAYDSIKCLALAFDVYNRQGYIKAGESGSNKDALRDAMSKKESPSNIGLQSAQNMADYLMSNDCENLDNVKAIVLNGFCKWTHAGYLAVAPLLWSKKIEADERARLRQAEIDADSTVSDYVGSTGQRLVFEIAECKLLTSWPTDYGMTYLYKMRDVSGNVLVWFASKLLQGFEHGKVKATVKDHADRDGVKQTILTRCAVV